MPGEFGDRALEALEQVQVEVGDAKTETTKLLASAIVFALLDVARAIRSSS